jgi:hypothetical protein
MNRARTSIADQRGAIFVQVGMVMVVLMAFSVFVLDYGVLWIARTQAQAAADAGALAGAVARGYDDFGSPPHHRDPAGMIARSVAQANVVWNQPPTTTVSFDCPAGTTGRCTRIDVFRDGTNSSAALETVFGPLLGVSVQRVRATATAITEDGNATHCLSPLAFPDDWDENRGPTEEFNRFVETGAGAGTLLNPRDDYQAATSAYAGRTTISGDYGERIVWVIDHPLGMPITRGLAVPLTLPGGRTFEQNMASCVGRPIAIGQRLPMDDIHPVIVSDALADVHARDSGADYDYGNSRIINSCAPGCAALSPRLLVVALYDPARFQLGRATHDWTQPGVDCPTNEPCVTVTNILGFFVHRITGGGFGPHGHFLRYPGSSVSTAPTLIDNASWLVSTHLIR